VGFREQENDQATLPILFQHSHWLGVESNFGPSEPAGCSKRPFSKAAGESKPEAYPLGYVEDFDEPRTLLADFFNSLLEMVLRHAVPECIAGEFEEPACFGDVAACALQGFF